MWTLILTVFLARGGVHIDHVDFATNSACERAKATWVNSIKAQGLNDWAVSYTAVCVEHD